MRLAAGKKDSVEFDDKEERDEILSKAHERKKIGISLRAGLHSYSDEELEEINRVGNHITGEMTERAVAFWLAQAGADAKRPPSLKEEIENKLPDIATTPHAIEIDVKSKTAWSFDEGLTVCFNPDQDQPEAPLRAILWCKPKRSRADFHKYDTLVPTVAEILGWVTKAEAVEADIVEGERRIATTSLRSPASLIEWIKAGALPAR